MTLDFDGARSFVQAKWRQNAMTMRLSWRNLLHDPFRFAATLIGIVFSVTLTSINGAVLSGFSQTAAGLVDNARGEVWIASRGTLNVDQSMPLNEKYIYQALRLPEVESATRLIVRFITLRKPNGGSELVILVGFDPRTGVGAPWNITDGDINALMEPGAIMFDRLYMRKLAVQGIGDEVEIGPRKARVVGFTSGIRTFTQSPYVFTTYNNALRFVDLPDGHSSFVVLKLKDPSQAEVVAASVARQLPDVDVLTSAQFSKKTRDYWIYTTGAGASLAFGAILGAIVGIVIVAQTLYAATVERLPEYATLSAMGAPHGYLNRIVIGQSLIAGSIGYVIALIIVWAVVGTVGKGAAAMVLSGPSMALIGLLAIALCAASSVLAIRKLMVIDPTSVFR